MQTLILYFYLFRNFIWISESCSVVSNSPGQNTGVGRLSLLQGNLPNPGIEPKSSTLQADSLLAEPQGKPKNTGVGRLSLLQRIFLTQESNRGLLHCRRILYQLSYEGSPIWIKSYNIKTFWEVCMFVRWSIWY